MTQADNPYLAPGVALEPAADGTTEVPRLLAWKGRIGRLRYLAYMLALFGIVMVAGFALVFVSTIAFKLAGGNLWSSYVAFLPALLGLVLCTPYIVLMKRRMHDTGHSGWLLLLALVPLVNLLLGLYLLCARGSAGPNQYGLPPAADTLAVKLAGWVMLVVMVVSLAASFLMPFMLAARSVGGGAGF